MPTWLIAGLCVAFVVVVVLFFRYLQHKRSEKFAQENAASRMPTTLPAGGFPHVYETPQGVAIASTVEIAEQHRHNVFSAIDAGITNLLNATRHHHPEWQAKNSHADFWVWFKDPDVYNQETEPGSPAILVYGFQSAGTVIGAMQNYYFEPKGGTAIICGHQAARDWRYLMYLMYTVWNEGEHDREWHNSRVLFNQFATSNDVHQHWPLPADIPMVLPEGVSAAVGFAATTNKAIPECRFFGEIPGKPKTYTVPRLAVIVE